MIFKIFAFIWKEYKFQAIIATLLLFVVSIVNGLSVAAIVPFIGTTGFSADSGSAYIYKIFHTIFSKIGILLSPINILIFLSILLFLKAVLNVSKAILFRSMQLDVEIDRKNTLYKSFITTDLTYLYQCNFGRITNIIINETRMIGMLIDYMARFSTCIFNMIIYVAVAFLISWQLTVLTAGLSFIFYILINRVFLKAKLLGLEIATLNGFIQEIINYTLSGYKIIKSFVVEEIFSRRLTSLLQKTKQANITLTAIESLLASVYEPLIVIMALIMYALYKFDLAIFLTFLVALFRTYQSFQEIQKTHLKMAHHIASFEMYEETLEGFRAHQYMNEKKGRQFEQLKEKISFYQVSFAYKTAKSHFRLGPINLTIPKGKMTGLVGSSGSGKSTCVDLIEGFLIPDEGKIEIDSENLFTYSLASWRKKIGYVAQDIFLINDTIYNNISFSDECITLEEVKEACHLAQASEFIEQLPNKYNTMLGELGTRLSGGQKQRIALARALVHKPEILILDEATSALDNESEKQVQKAIDFLSGEITIVVIAHRLSTVKNADYIYMFEDGKIIEEGTFDGLLQKQGKFFQMYSSAQ